MASCKLKTTKAGKRFYEISVSRGYGVSPFTSRWYVPDGWSKKSIDRELRRVSADFERRCRAGEVLTRAQLKERQEQEEAEAAKIQTVRQYGERVFMPQKAITIAENTRSSFELNLNKWIYPAIGDRKLPEVTAADISALLLDMQAQGKSHSSVIKVYTIMALLFKSAYMDDSINRNPMDKVQRPRPRKDEEKGKEVEAFSAEELRKILACLENEPLKWRAFVRLLIDTGIRRGEACGLQWRYVDFDRNEITIAKNLCYTPQKGVYEDTPKSGRTRVLNVDPAVMALLRDLRREQADRDALSPYVFTQEGSSEPMHPQSPTRYFSQFGKRYGIDGFHPHRLRHSYASLAIINGADVASVSQNLGHADTAVTLRVYAHADEESRKRASQIMREAISSDTSAGR